MNNSVKSTVMKKNITPAILLLLFGIAVSCNKNDNEDPIEVPEGYSLVWSDEFNGPTIDLNNWNYQTGDGTDYGLPAGWGNNEKQIYTDIVDNSSIMDEDGSSILAINALEDGSGGYTSARLTTKGLFSVRFGRIDIRAKVAEGQGLWSAIWMLGDNIDSIGWPGCGEVDILEVLGHESSVGYNSLHYTNGEKKHGESRQEVELTGGSFSEGYHVFSLVWSPETIAFMLDGIESEPLPVGTDMKEFLRGFYLIVNVAVGGNWPGDPDGTTVFPQSMMVDYIRVFSKDGMEVPAAPPLNIDEETVGQVIEPNVGDHAIQSGFTYLGNLEVISYGGGGEPMVSASDTAIDGDKSLRLDFPGGNWGGAYFELQDPRDLSGYTHLRFSLNKPSYLVKAEIKLESQSTFASVFLENYTGVPVSEGFEEYTIPLADFTGLDLTTVTIPFALWNPKNAYDAYVGAKVLIDNVYFGD
jgi:beta-glucanase (GH16 family)